MKHYEELAMELFNELDNPFQLTKEATKKDMLSLDQFLEQATHECSHAMAEWLSSRYEDIEVEDLLEPFRLSAKRFKKGEITAQDVAEEVFRLKYMVEEMLAEDFERKEETYRLLQDSIMLDLIIMYIYSLPKGVAEFGVCRKTEL